MYEAYWKLKLRPFDDGAAPEFYCATRTHQTALLKLRYLVQERKGIGLIVGEHGTGKSFLTHLFESEARSEAIDPFVRLIFPQLSPEGALAYLANRLGVNGATESLLLSGLEDRLAELQSEQRHVVFVIDDAHLLDIPHLHMLRLLLNLREDGRADFSVILSGRTELLARLQKLASLEQRVVVRAALSPLPLEEVLPYVRRRLEAAGRQDLLFNERSARTLWELSQGIPRRINQLCDLALLVGFVDDQNAIGPVEIEAAAAELSAVAA